MLFVRRIGSLDSQPVTGTEDVSTAVDFVPFWSPDSQSLGFHAPASGKLKAVDVAGGHPRVLCDVRRPSSRAAPGTSTTILCSVRAIGSITCLRSGGTPALLATPSPPLQVALRWPQFLPDGRRYLYQAASAQPSTRAVWLKSLDSDETTQLLLAESHAAFAPPHFLLFTRQRTLVAQRLDVSTLKPVGEPSPIVDDVLLAANGRAAFGVSDAGVLAYRAGEATRSLVWVERSGKVSDPDWRPECRYGYQAVPRRHTRRLSPADTRRCRRCIHLRHRTESAHPHLPSIQVPTTSRSGRLMGRMWRTPGSATRTRESTKCGLMGRRPSESLSRWTLTLALTLGRSIGDATLLWFRRNRNTADHDFGTVGAPTIGRPNAIPLSASSCREQAALSPNGRWLAYSTNDGGVDQVIVQSFPDPSKGRHPVSSKGGIRPTLESQRTGTLLHRFGTKADRRVRVDGWSVQNAANDRAVYRAVTGVRCGAGRGAFSVQRLFHGLSQPAPNQPCPELDDGTEVTWFLLRDIFK